MARISRTGYFFGPEVLLDTILGFGSPDMASFAECKAEHRSDPLDCQRMNRRWHTCCYIRSPSWQQDFVGRPPRKGARI